MSWNLAGFEWSLSRRNFLRAGAAGTAACTFAADQPERSPVVPRAGCAARSVIMICNLGGPSQIDTWDPKPDAVAEVRGPFQPIGTCVPGLFLSELFPRHAQIAQHLAFVRSCYHTSPGVHHAGWQCMHSGREWTDGIETPHVGSLAGYLLGRRGNLPAHVVLPAPLRFTHRGQSAGQQAGYLGACHEPCSLYPTVNRRPARRQSPRLGRDLLAAADLAHESESTRARYGDSPFGQRCLVARRLVESNVRFVTVNTFVDLQHEPTWDQHGLSPSGPSTQLRDQVAPMYDQAVSALIEDLHARGMLADTLVCCVAEFGRTPRMNEHGGRDHWPHCFTTYFAGGGVQGGQVIGRSDAVASEPVDRPVAPAEIVASIWHSLGLAPTTPWLDPAGIRRPLVDAGAGPIAELF